MRQSVRGRAQAVGRRIGDLSDRVRHWERPHPWRRSLALRAISVTLLLGMLLLLALGTYVSGRIATQLVEERRRTAQTEAATATRSAQDTFDHTDRLDYEGLMGVAQQVVRSIESPPEGPRERLVVLQAAADEPDRYIPPVFSSTITPDAIPADLRRALAADPEHQQVKTVALPTKDGSVTVVMVGSRVTLPAGRRYDLYVVFPMEREQRTLADTQSSLLAASLGALAILVIVSLVATRMVIAPLRTAARTSSALAAGDLDVRMPVHGEDDLARLGVSFNTMADSLRNQIRKLEHLSQVQQRFVSDVSHELRTPLTTIRMATEVLSSGRATYPPPIARSAELLSQEVTRFESLLADLLEISRIDAGAAVLERDTADISTLVLAEVEAAGQLAETVGAKVRLHGTDEAQLADVDSRRIARVLRNLVVNAIEHSEGRPVDITVAGNVHAVAVLVQDHGIGLTAEQGRLVFARFWRADPARNRTSGGTGLGLAIALEDTQMHGGWLQCAGTPGRGASFRLTLPRAVGTVLRASPIPVANLWPTDRQAADELVAQAPHGGAR